MSILNRNAIKTYIKGVSGKQISNEYFQILERKVIDIVDVSIRNARAFKRIQAGDLNGGIK